MEKTLQRYWKSFMLELTSPLPMPVSLRSLPFHDYIIVIFESAGDADSAVSALLAPHRASTARDGALALRSPAPHTQAQRQRQSDPRLFAVSIAPGAPAPTRGIVRSTRPRTPPASLPRSPGAATARPSQLRKSSHMRKHLRPSALISPPRPHSSRTSGSRP